MLGRGFERSGSCQKPPESGYFGGPNWRRAGAGVGRGWGEGGKQVRDGTESERVRCTYKSQPSDLFCPPLGHFY